MRDAVLLAERQIPAVALVTEEFWPQVIRQQEEHSELEQEARRQHEESGSHLFRKIIHCGGGVSCRTLVGRGGQPDQAGDEV